MIEAGKVQASGPTFDYYGRSIPVGSTTLQIREWAEELSVEKKIDAREVERQLLDLQLAAATRINSRKERSLTFVK